MPRTISFADMPFESVERADREGGDCATSKVCVVGSGPAGLTLAHALGAAGRSVTVLESGRSDHSAEIQRLNDGDVEGEPYAGLEKTRHRGLGGSANIWNVEIGSQPGAKYAPLSPRDIESWPIEWADLEPFYREAQEVCGLGRFQYDAEAWATASRRPFDLGGTGLVNRIYQFGLANRFTRELVAELQAMENVRIVPLASAVGLEMNLSGRRVRGVRWIDGSGATFEERAECVVLACGAVENPRLLMMASRGSSPTPWLGRGFMEHARDFSLELVPFSPDLFERAAFYDLHTGAGGTRIGGRLAISDDALDRFDLSNGSITLFPRSSSEARPSFVDRVIRRLYRRRGRRRSRRYGWSEMTDPAGTFHVLGMVLNLEQRPDPRNRIELGARRDRFGNPLPKLFLDWSVDEQKRLDRLRSLLRDWLEVAGLGTLRFEPGRRPDLSAHHHAGTTRMAGRPEDGVVSPECRVFGYENLYVAGASVFPTAGFANPTLTIVALSRRLARHLLSQSL
jgi:choline dehydrogenase-like flavoprotein